VYSTPLSFICPQDVPNVTPPLRKGTREGVWVKTRTEDEKEIRQAGVNKLQQCYGISLKPEDFTVYSGFQY